VLPGSAEARLREKGEKGEKGVKGAKGLKGLKGAKGAKGEKSNGRPEAAGGRLEGERTCASTRSRATRDGPWR